MNLGLPNQITGASAGSPRDLPGNGELAEVAGPRGSALSLIYLHVALDLYLGGRACEALDRRREAAEDLSHATNVA